VRIFVSVIVAAGCALAQSSPTAEISNGLVRAVIQLPDREHGSYRGTRFDWAGIISSLQYSGHEYVGKWHDVDDPKIHDAVTGPAEEFLTNDSAFGYAKTKPGDIFPRIGVGSLRKPAGETAYRRFGTYEIVDPGNWTVKKHQDQIEFAHELNLGSGGYAYVYKKTVRLAKGKPELTVEHSLRNTGAKVIETSQYSHNFFAMDHQVVGPDVTIAFAFIPVASPEMKYGARIQNHEITYARELEEKQAASADISGFGPEAKDYDIRVENHRLGTGVHIMGDQPLEKLHFWSIRTVASPEPYVRLTVPPGREARWTIRYEFYAAPNGKTGGKLYAH
jgi:hypothetical protein